MSESIVCRTCAVTMTTEHCEAGRDATTCWHSCPVCGQRRMTSEPGRYEARDARRAAAPGAPSLDARAQERDD